MNIVYSDSYTDNYEKQFGFSRLDVENAILEKDEIEKVDVDGLIMVFFKKKIETHDTVYYWLVGSEDKRSELNILFAFGLDGTSPLDILNKFVESFGFDVIIGDETRKFFIKDSILIRNPIMGGNLVGYKNEGKNFISNQNVKTRPALRGSIMVDVALVYCIDTGKYKERLKN